jgi:hypothetical protein
MLVGDCLSFLVVGLPVLRNTMTSDNHPRKELHISSATTGAVLIAVIIMGVLLIAYLISQYWIMGARLPRFVRKITGACDDEEQASRART